VSGVDNLLSGFFMAIKADSSDFRAGFKRSFNKIFMVNVGGSCGNAIPRMINRENFIINKKPY